MIQTLVALLIIVWLAGIATSYTLGGFVHILLAVALVILVVDFLGRRKST